MDTKSTSKNNPSIPENIRRSPLDNRVIRFILFLATFVVAGVIAAATYAGKEVTGVAPPRSLGQVWMLMSDLFAVFFFPGGLQILFTGDHRSDVGSFPAGCLGWLLYLGAPLFGVLFKKRSVFLVLYVIFLVVLIVNVVGCAAGFGTGSGIGNLIPG